MAIIIPANSAADTAYSIDNSCRFNSASSSQLKRTAGTATDPEKYTFSCWIKRGSLVAINMQLIACEPNGSEREWLFFVDTNQWLKYMGHISPTASKNIITTQKFRDVAAWCHVVLTFDSGQSTAANRIKLYLNGTQITDLSGDSSTAAYVIQNADSPLNTSGNVFCVGANWNFHSGGYAEGFYNGYMAEVFFCDGQALAPSSFGEFNSDSPTIWQPIDCSGDLTFGDNGFYLNFSDSADLGADSSGNSNDFTVTNLAAVDQCTDTPTNNFCTMNPLRLAGTLSEGNCTYVPTATAHTCEATIGITAGKWYWEMRVSDDNQVMGLLENGISVVGNSDDNYPSYTILNNGSTTWTAYNNVSAGNQGSTFSGTAVTDSGNDIVMMAFDADNENLYVGLNGTWQNSGDPTSGATGTGAVITSVQARYGGTLIPFVGVSAGASRTFDVNFGNPTWSLSSAVNDGNGYGNFEYAPPSGFLALCTKNLGSDGG